jgi:hypothetical protein
MMPATEKRSRFATLNEFVDCGHARLRKQGCGAAAALWFCLWRFASAENDTVRVGLGTLAECFGSDRRNVQRMLAQLEQHGYLVTLAPGKHHHRVGQICGRCRNRAAHIRNATAL